MKKILESFKAIRDMVVFTSLRVISVNVQGITASPKLPK
ncbi:MAG: PH domain-containing protein [Clostridiales bacterium]|nr:PH domain-containing protein [Clostridiales bacterium]